MINRIVIENFKSFKQVDLKLGALNLFIGSNASGKSNFFDALRVLQGIGNGFTISEILDGKHKSDTSAVWEGIRGGSGKACFENGPEGAEVRMLVSGQFPGDNGTAAYPRTTGEYLTRDGKRIVIGEGLQRCWEFEVGFAPSAGRVTRERLVQLVEVYDSAPVEKNWPGDPVLQVKYFEGKRGRQPHLRFDRSRPVLTQFAQTTSGKWKKTDADKAARVARLLANTQRVDPLPSLLRAYSQAPQIQRMGEHGENFAALVRTLCADPPTKGAYVSWLRQLRPAEVDDVGTLSGALGEPLFMLREGNKEFPAPVLSDGTLRFAAITAALFQPDMPAVMTIEEIENGVHASRLRLLVELLRDRAATGTTQFMVTTHSPIVLAWLKPEEYAHTFFCKRDEATGESRICPVTEVPHFMEVVKRQPISDLFAEGWLETAL